MKTDSKIITYKDLPAIRARATRAGKKIVFASGCYDLVHLGHAAHFDHIAKKGDILVVSVANDATVRSLKGPSRPLLPQSVRSRMVAALASVDYVAISRESGIFDHLEILDLLRPDYYVGSLKDKHAGEKKMIAKKIGARFIVPSHKGVRHEKDLLSTTALEKRIQKI